MSARCVIAFAAAIVLARTASAAPSVVLSLAPDGAQDLEATILGVASVRVPIDAITLRDPADDATPILATRVRSYAKGDEPIAIAFVMEGDERWVGNTDYARDDDDHDEGALAAVERGIDAMDLDVRTPRVSTATLIAYANRAGVVMPTSPISALRGPRFGIQLDYLGRRGADLRDGVEIGIEALARSSLPRKALVVLGDGNDTNNTNNETGHATFAELREHALAAHIDMFAVVLASARSRPGVAITQLIPATRTVTSADAMAATLEDIARELCDRSYVTFPSADLRWDGEPHALVVSLGGEVLAPVTLTLPDHTCWFGSSRALAIVALLVGGVVLTRDISRRRRRRRAERMSANPS
jgi:hypothetical protein